MQVRVMPRTAATAARSVVRPAGGGPPNVPRARKAAPRRWQGSELAPTAQREGKRRAILAAAAAAFTERGYHETSLADLAERLNVTKPTLYYYIASKEAMLVAIASSALADAELQLERSRTEGGDALEALRIFARFYVAGMTTDFGRCLLAVRHTRLAPATQRKMDLRFRRIDAMVRALIEDGVRDGAIRTCDVRVATFALFGAMNGVPHWYDARGPLGVEATGDALFDIFARGLAAGTSVAG